MNTLESLNLYDVDIEDIDIEIPGCSFYMEEDTKNSKEPYDRYLQIISKEVEVIEYDKKSNTATMGLSNFVHDNFEILNDIFDIPCPDPEDEYLNILVAMINGYESKLFYDAFCNAYDEGKLNKQIKENINDEKELIKTILEEDVTFDELKESLQEILDEGLISDNQYDKIYDIVENTRKNFVVYLHDWEECCGGDSPQESDYVENAIVKILENIEQEESLNEEEEDVL